MYGVQLSLRTCGLVIRTRCYIVIHYRLASETIQSRQLPELIWMCQEDSVMEVKSMSKTEEVNDKGTGGTRDKPISQ